MGLRGLESPGDCGAQAHRAAGEGGQAQAVGRVMAGTSRQRPQVPRMMLPRVLSLAGQMALRLVYSETRLF